METSYKSKPYYFVPFTEKTVCHEPTGYQDLLCNEAYIGKLAVTITCVTPLHFGSGRFGQSEVSGNFVHSLLREGSRIALPGSSFKGMLRSVFEAVTESCVLNSPKLLIEKIGLRRKCSGKFGLCPACSVFGRLSYKGKLIFSSFNTEAEPLELVIPDLEQPFRTYPLRQGSKDPGTGNERLYYGDFRNLKGIEVASMSKKDFWDRKKQEPGSGGDFYGRKFYKHSYNWDKLLKEQKGDIYECLPAGTHLHGTIAYQGLSRDELGALLFALGLGWGQPIYHKLGYAKPAFLGSIELKVESLPLPRYETQKKTDLENLACRYYQKHQQSIAPAAAALKAAWSDVGNEMWVQQNGKYGY